MYECLLVCVCVWEREKDRKWEIVCVCVFQESVIKKGTKRKKIRTENVEGDVWKFWKEKKGANEQREKERLCVCVYKREKESRESVKIERDKKQEK